MNADKFRKPWRWFSLVIPLALAGWVLWKILPSSDSSVEPTGHTREEIDPSKEINASVIEPDAKPAIASELAEKLGIEIMSLQVAVGGSRINFRYRVLDPVRATQLFNPLHKAFLLDSSGQNLVRPNTPIAASLRADSGQHLRAGRIYTYFFPNPGQAIKSGDTVTLVIGNYRAEGLVVR
jgi:hypothetical protein